MFSMDLRFTLCFLTRNENVLMLLRRKPPNQGLWNGIGGHIEAGEKPVESVLREIREETGYNLPAVVFRGILTWEGFEIPSGGLFIFTAEAPENEPVENGEGHLDWKTRSWVTSSPEVVSNIHVFGPHTLGDEAPVWHHFVYTDGKIEQYQQLPLPDLRSWGLSLPAKS